MTTLFFFLYSLFIYYIAIHYSSPTLVAVYNAVQPFGAGVMSHGVASGKHAASLVEFCSAALVCSGVLLLRSDELKVVSVQKMGRKKSGLGWNRSDHVV